MEDVSLYDLLSDTYYDVLDKFKQDSRLEEYWDIPMYLTEDDNKILDYTDSKFYESEGELFTRTAYEYYCKKLKKTVIHINN